MRTSPVTRAISLPRLNYGVSSKALGYCWGPTALVAVLTGSSQGWLWAGIPISVGFTAHLILQWLFQKDARIFEMYVNYARLADSYHPHARESLPATFERPHKVGRGIRF